MYAAQGFTLTSANTTSCNVDLLITLFMTGNQLAISSTQEVFSSFAKVFASGFKYSDNGTAGTTI